jgi:16S rRNA processing protein RimM
MLDVLEIGVITSTHGLKGEVNIYPVTDNVSRFDALKEILLEREGGFDSVQVEKVRYFKNRPILKMKGYDRIEDVERLKGQSIYVRRSDAVALQENEYFIGDLIGLDVVLEDGSRFGTLTDVLRTGANDVYAVKKDDGSTVYLPAIKDVILHTDPEVGTITVRPMKEI